MKIYKKNIQKKYAKLGKIEIVTGNINVPRTILFMLGCLVLMTWSIYKIADARHFDKVCERTEGVLVDYDSDWDVDRAGHRSDYYKCVYKYWVADVSYTVERRESARPELGDVEILYYDPEDPEDARFYTNGFNRVLNDVVRSVFCLLGTFFFFINLAFIMARYKVATPQILIIEGTLLTILGISIPILTRGAGGVLSIGGLAGIFLCIIGYQQLRNEKKEQPRFQDMADDMMDEFFKGRDEV